MLFRVWNYGNNATKAQIIARCMQGWVAPLCLLSMMNAEDTEMKRAGKPAKKRRRLRTS